MSALRQGAPRTPVWHGQARTEEAAIRHSVRVERALPLTSPIYDLGRSGDVVAEYWSRRFEAPYSPAAS